MEKNKRRNFRPQELTFTLNHEEFYDLTDLLFEVLKENNSACARVLGINQRTWMRWSTVPPTMPHWNMILRYVIKEILKSMVIHRVSHAKKTQRRMLDALAKIPDSTDFTKQIEHEAYNESEAMLHLRTLLQRGGMFWDEIKLPGSSGGYSPQTLRAAAKRLSVVRSQEGFGKAKRSFWRLPGPDD